MKTLQIYAAKWKRDGRDWQNTDDWWTCPECAYVKEGMPKDFVCYRCGKVEGPWLPGVWRPEGTLVMANEEPL